MNKESKLTSEVFFANLQNPQGGDRVVKFLRLAAETGELFELIPELEPMTTQMQNCHHQEGTVWEHTLRVISHTDGGSLRLRLAALLHDVGKPATATPHEKYPGEFRFIGHEDVGAEMAWNIIYRLVPANQWLEKKDGSTEKQMTVNDATLAMDVEWLVMNHMRAHRLQEMSRKKQAEILRCRGACDLIELAYADAMGREPQLKEAAESNRAFCAAWISSDVSLRDIGITVEEMVTLEPDLPKCVTKMGIMENLLTKDPTKTREELLKAVGLGE